MILATSCLRDERHRCRVGDWVSASSVDEDWSTQVSIQVLQLSELPFEAFLNDFEKEPNLTVLEPWKFLYSGPPDDSGGGVWTRIF